MTNAELLCDFMEPRPKCHYADSWTARKHGVNPKWWMMVRGTWRPIILDLDLLREIEERLTDEQWRTYWHDGILAHSVLGCAMHQHYRAKVFLHASAEQKIQALVSAIFKDRKAEK